MAFASICAKREYFATNTFPKNRVQSPMGIPVAMVEAKKREILARQANKNERDKIAATIDSTVSQVNGNYQAFLEIGGALLKSQFLYNPFGVFRSETNTSRYSSKRRPCQV